MKKNAIEIIEENNTEIQNKLNTIADQLLDCLENGLVLYPDTSKQAFFPLIVTDCFNRIYTFSMNLLGLEEIHKAELLKNRDGVKNQLCHIGRYALTIISLGQKEIEDRYPDTDYLPSELTLLTAGFKSYDKKFGDSDLYLHAPKHRLFAYCALVQLLDFKKSFHKCFINKGLFSELTQESKTSYEQMISSLGGLLNAIMVNDAAEFYSLLTLANNTLENKDTEIKGFQKNVDSIKRDIYAQNAASKHNINFGQQIKYIKLLATKIWTKYPDLHQKYVVDYIAEAIFEKFGSAESQILIKKYIKDIAAELTDTTTTKKAGARPKSEPKPTIEIEIN